MTKNNGKKMLSSKMKIKRTWPKKPADEIVIKGKDYTFGQQEWLQDRAALERKSVAAIVRDAIDAYRYRMDKQEDIVKTNFE